MAKRGRKRLLKLIGPKLRRMRDQAAQTQLQTSLRIGLELNHYCKLERGERLPDTTTLILIADAYDVSADYLLSRTRKREILEEEVVSEVEQEIPRKIHGWEGASSAR